ncbi:Pycsar system effector family protein [Granulosicoccus antarcticus]|uniref:Pycsar system effector family protein n=1 Tax=Granulosicoccus antarcticus TaxID=437505 RepID=UPI0012FDEA80|nr:Pycsar system effector family protein [Granulosicoccus antarcticus]
MLPLNADGSSAAHDTSNITDPLVFELRKDSPVLLPSVIQGDLVGRGPLRKPGNSEKSDMTGTPKRSKKKNVAKKENKPRKKNKILARRGIDTLLRNAYRAQLDMLSLAAVKANIMISLNGLLISMLIISGTHFIGVDIWFAIPITLFLLSSAMATVFAVLAARPDVSRKKFTPKDFKENKAHLLAFEEFSDLSEKQYVEAMSYMLADDDRVYKNMISHVHELGSTADRKYRKLHYSYTVFIGGIILSVMSLLIIESMKWTNHLPLL